MITQFPSRNQFYIKYDKAKSVSKTESNPRGRPVFFVQKKGSIHIHENIYSIKIFTINILYSGI